MGLAVYVALLHRSEQTLADSFRAVAEGHAADADVFHLCRTLAGMSDRHVDALAPVAERYGSRPDEEPQRLHADGVVAVRTGPVGLLRDLQHLYLLASLVDTSWTVIHQAAMGARDAELQAVVDRCEAETKRQLAWLTTKLKSSSPQALLAPPP